MKQKRRRTRPRPMALRSQAQREVIARLMLLGCTAERIARRLGCTSRAIRYAISTPEFEQLFNRLQAERLKILDRKMNGLLHAAVKALGRQLKHHDGRVVNDTLEIVFKLHGRYVEKFDLTASLDHTGNVTHMHQGQLIPLDDMSPAARKAAREFLEATRPLRQKALPPALSQANSLDDEATRR